MTNPSEFGTFGRYCELALEKDGSARIAPRSRRLVSARMNNMAFIVIKMGRRTKSHDSPPRIGSMVHEKNRVNCLAGGLCD